MQAIERAFAVLRALRSADGSAGVSAVARSTGLPKSTVSRLLVSLEAVGVIERMDTAGNYAIGPGLAVLATGASTVMSLRDVARPHLRELTESVGESAGLTVPDGPTALYVDHIAFESSVLTRDWTGMRFPYHTVAGGLAMMMTWTETEVARFVGDGLEVFTDKTSTTATALKRRLTTASRTGYAWTRGDFDLEINGVAAPVRNTQGRAIGAVTVYGPSYRFPGERDPDDLGQQVRRVARTVQQQHHP